MRSKDDRGEKKEGRLTRKLRTERARKNKASVVVG